MCRDDALMAEPDGDGRDVDAGLEHPQRRRVTKGMGRDILLRKRRGCFAGFLLQAAQA